MRILQSSFCLGFGLLLSVPNVSADPIPPPTGKYHVGIRRHVVPFNNRDDPTSPNNVSTEYLATIYYPTTDKAASPHTYLEPELAKGYADLWAYNISHLTSNLRWNASFLREPSGPTLLFGPGGWGPPTDGYTILLSELASQGYVIAALDHVYEQPFLRFPNGTGVYGLPLDYPGDFPFVESLHDVRVREMLHFISYLPKLVKKWNAPFKTKGLGTFGHSVGGSVALTVALESSAVAAAINQDGTNWNRLNKTSDSDLKKPSLLLGFEQHNLETDPTWENYINWQSGWWRLFTVNGTSHLDWSDATFWKTFGTSKPLGTIDGRRMVTLTNAYVSAFFDKHLLHKKRPILDGPSKKWPEVNFLASSQQ